MIRYESECAGFADGCRGCGTDIQTEEDKAITALTELYQYGSFIPSDAREKFRESTQFACKVLKKRSEIE